MPRATEVISVRRDVLAAARERAADFRERMTARGTFVINLISSPGAGKTTLIAATARHWGGERTLAALTGDIATERDAERLRPWAPVAQLTTGGACHLEWPLVERGWQALGEPDVEFLFVENVGNLVCPASHDLGEHLRVILLATTEGDDKPAKYPKAFRTSQAMVINKIDLLQHVPFSVEAAAADARSIQPDLQVLPVSAWKGEGIAAWCDYLSTARRAIQEQRTCPMHS